MGRTLICAAHVSNGRSRSPRIADFNQSTKINIMPDDNPTQAAPTVARPAVFIGLGSTGSRIVSYLQELIEKHGDDWTSQWFNFLVITSEESREPGVSNRVQHIPMSQGNMDTVTVVDNFIKSGNRELADEVNKWWYFDSRGEPWYPPFEKFDEGCGGERAAGRMLAQSADLAQYLRDLTTKLEQSYDDLVNKGDPTANQVTVKSIDCYVFGLLAGGTCCGMFLDFAFLLKGILPGAKVVGNFLLGDICFEGALSAEKNPARAHVQRHNTMYALAELFVLQSKDGRDITFREWPRNLSVGSEPLSENLFKPKTAPYDSVILVGAHRDSGTLLTSFDAYSRLVAEYYGRLFVTQTIALSIGRAVDDAVIQNSTLDDQYSNRPNNIGRIGLLNLRLPDEAVLALCEGQMATEIAARYFASPDPARCQETITAFENAVSWNNLAAQFEPQADSFIPSASDDPIPASADEFRQNWESRKCGMDGYYGDWRNLRKSETVLMEWLRKAKEALHAMKTDLVGGGSSAGVSLASFKFVLKTLQDKVAGFNQELQNDINIRETALFAPNDGHQSLFQKELETQAGEFPGKWNPLRGRWPGQGDVRQKLEGYRQQLRALAIETVMSEAMKRLGKDIDRMLVIVDLVTGPYCAQKLLLEKQRGIDKAFKEDQRRLGIQHPVIHGRDEIDRLFVRRILTRPPTKGTEQQAIGSLFQERVIKDWVAKGDLLNKCDRLAELLEASPSVANANAAWEERDIKEVVAGLGKAFEASFARFSEDTISREINQYSAWDAIRFYVEGKGGDHETTLTDLFATYAKSSSLFAKLNGAERRDPFYSQGQVTRTMRLLCDKQEAKDCFSDLGLEHIDLKTLLQRTFRTQPEILDKPGQRDVLLFSSESGHNPMYFDGFDDIQNLLCSDPKEQKADLKRWSDRRWPDWIRSLLAQKP
jgi:hypothetical protein